MAHNFSSHFQSALSSMGGLPPPNSLGGLQMISRPPMLGTNDSLGSLPPWAYNHPALTPMYPHTESLAENWRQFQQAAYNYNLDPHILALYGQGLVPGHHRDLGPRRKNATRETTSILKAWLNEHKKNPYPTKGEKIMLAIITTMTLTQVSTWFANARRRLKKENKMTWVPRNRSDDEGMRDDEDSEIIHDDQDDAEVEIKEDETEDKNNNSKDSSVEETEARPIALPPLKRYRRDSAGLDEDARTPSSEEVKKPRIWSIVDTVNKSEPPKLRSRSPPMRPSLSMPPQQHFQHLPPPPGFTGANLSRLASSLGAGGLPHPALMHPFHNMYQFAGGHPSHPLAGAPFHPFSSFGRLQAPKASSPQSPGSH